MARRATRSPRTPARPSRGNRLRPKAPISLPRPRLWRPARRPSSCPPSPNRSATPRRCPTRRCPRANSRRWAQLKTLARRRSPRSTIARRYNRQRKNLSRSIFHRWPRTKSTRCRRRNRKILPARQPPAAIRPTPARHDPTPAARRSIMATRATPASTPWLARKPVPASPRLCPRPSSCALAITPRLPKDMAPRKKPKHPSTPP